jgi:hypothetical protein
MIHFYDHIMLSMLSISFVNHSVVRTAMYGLVPWLRHLLIQEVGVPLPGADCLPDILRQLDRPLCPACVHPGKLCPVCETISFRKPGSFDWGLWVQSALMYITWLPRGK